MKRSRPFAAATGRRVPPARRRFRFESLESRRLLASLAGQVWNDLDADRALDADESGIADVRVYLDVNDNGMREPTEDFAWTDEAGAFMIDELPAGDYVVRLEQNPQIHQSSPNAYVGTAYQGSTGQTQLFEMDLDGAVRRIGSPTAEPIHGLIRTNDGVILGSSFQTDAIYTIDPQTGAESVLGTTGAELVAGLAYDPATDTVYTVGQASSDTTIKQLMTVDPITGATTPIGIGVDGGPANTSDLTFDTLGNRVIGFDNNADSFFSFDLDGTYEELGTISGGFNSWSLAFNGDAYIMMDQDHPTKQRAVTVDPETGEVSDAFTASESVPSESLFYATRGDVAYRVTVADDESVVDLNFGVGVAAGTDFDRTKGRVAFINELLLDPVFSVSGRTEQYLELRGEPNQRLPLGTYFIAVDGNNFLSSNNDGAGTILTTIDLSNQRFGANGMLVLLPQNSAFQPHPEANVLRSNAPGFSGLPGDIFQTDSFGIWGDASIAHFGLGDFSYLLVQSDTPPLVLEDIDADDDGVFDFDSPASEWIVYDSVSVHSFNISPSIAYGSVVYYDTVFGPINVQVSDGATLIAAEDVGYVARIGDSTGYTKDDWIGSSVLHNGDSQNLRYYLEDGFFGPPRPYVYQGRFLDHVGESNFVGGVRGVVAHDLNGNDVSDPDEPPLVGTTVLADTNGNGVRDSLSFVLEPDAYPHGTDLRNVFPGVTLTQTLSGSEPTGGTITADRPFLADENDHVFARGSIERFTPNSQLRFDFYRPVNTVAIDAIGTNNFSAVYGRLEAFNADGESLGFVRSNALGDDVRQTLQLEFTDDVIAYAVAYSDTDHLSSSPSGQFDRLQFSQYEATAVTDENGYYEIFPLVVDAYEIRLSGDTVFQIGAEPRTARVERYENYHFDFAVRPNSGPQIASASFELDEHARAGTVIGLIQGSDPDVGQEVRYRIIGGSAAEAVSINAQTGELRVRRSDALDFETNPEELVIVEAFDPFGATATAAAAITLHNINDQPVIDTEELFISEGAPEGLVIGRIQFSDQDSGSDGTTTIEVVGGTAADVVAVDPDTGTVTLINAAAIDFETNPAMSLRVVVTDQANEPRDRIAEINLHVRDTNEAPTILTDSLTVAETIQSEEAFGLIDVDDPDFDQNHFFRVEGGSGAELFVVDRNSGVVSLARNASLDFEAVGSYTLQVLVSDSGSPALSDSATIEIVLSDVNEPPVLVDSRFSVTESAQPGDAFGQLVAVDPDPSQSLDFEIVGGSGQQWFRVDSDGTLRFDGRTGDLDFETTNQYGLLVRITDDGIPVAAGTFSVVVDILDAPEPPRIATLQVEVPEDALPGSTVSQVDAADPDHDDTVEFSIVGGSAEGLFDIDADTGVLSVTAEALLDHETEPELTLIVQVIDQTGRSARETVSVQIADRNERPLITTPIANPVIESGRPFEMTFDQSFVDDPDDDQTLAISVTGINGALPDWLHYDPTTGVLSGFPNQSHVGTIPVAFRVNDGFASAVQIFNLIVRPSLRPFQNGQDAMDVDNNRLIEPVDALRIINYINRFGTGPIPASAVSFEGFVDTNGDGQVTPLDILGVLNRLNRQSTNNIQGASEGELAAAAAAAAAVPDESEKRRAASTDAVLAAFDENWL